MKDNLIERFKNYFFFLHTFSLYLILEISISNSDEVRYRRIFYERESG